MQLINPNGLRPNRPLTPLTQIVMCVVVGLQIVREGEGDGCCALQYPRCYSTACTVHGTAAARVLGALGTPAAGFAHGRQEGRDFLLISCLIRLIHLLSLYREVYLTPKQTTN